MKSYQLAEGESVLYLFADASILITDKRIRKLSQPGDISGLTSIMLEDISSIKVQRHTHYWSLILAVFLLVVGIGGVLEFYALGLVGLGLSAVLLFYYYQTMQDVVEFRSTTGVITLPLNQLENENVVDMINKIEHARILRNK